MSKKFFIIAGEASGDWLGAKLMQELKNNKICGIGGKKMEAVGLKSLFNMSEISLMGFAEILPHAAKLIKLINFTVDEINKFKPDVVVTIDSPGFNFRVAKKIQSLRPQTKLIHYVAPTVWAYKPKRAEKVNALFDKLLCILPFEPPYFNNAEFIGHPVLEDGLDKGNAAAFKEKYKIDDFICLMPGSRKGEVRKLLPIFLSAARILGKKPVVIAADNVVLPEGIIKIPNAEKADCFAASSCGIIKSGTSGLEYAFAGKPYVVAYKANKITAYMVKRMIKIKFVNLVNILFEREIVPELIQENCTAEKIADALKNHKAVDKNELVRMLSREGGGQPSAFAASLVAGS